MTDSATTHAEVLAGLAAMESTLDALGGAGFGGRWSVLRGVEIAVVADDEWLVASGFSRQGADAVVAAVNSLRAGVDMARRVATEHTPHAPGDDGLWSMIPWTYCRGCAYAVRLMPDGENSIAPPEWPCNQYRAAALYAGVDLDAAAQPR